MTTASRPRSATKFETATAKPVRPTATITIGSGEYTVRAPKIDVWRETFHLMSAIDSVRNYDPDAEVTADPAEAAELDAIILEIADFRSLETAIITGRELIGEDGERMLEGGFLRRSLTPADWAAVKKEWKSDEADLDVDDLFAAAREVQELFGDWFKARESAMGLPSTEATAKARKKTTATRAR